MLNIKHLALYNSHMVFYFALNKMLKWVHTYAIHILALIMYRTFYSYDTRYKCISYKNKDGNWWMKEVGNINWTEKKLLVFIKEYGMRVVVEYRFRETKMFFFLHKFTWISMHVSYIVHHVTNYIQYSSEVSVAKKNGSIHT